MDSLSMPTADYTLQTLWATSKQGGYWFRVETLWATSKVVTATYWFPVVVKGGYWFRVVR